MLQEGFEARSGCEIDLDWGRLTIGKAHFRSNNPREHRFDGEWMTHPERRTS